MLTKSLLRVSRAGGGYHPQFADEGDERLAARVIGIYQGHVGRPREELEEALTGLEREADDFKLVRGLAKLLDRDAAFETNAPLDPARVRQAVFEEAAAIGVVTTEEREDALTRAAERLGVTTSVVEDSLYADHDDRQVLADLSLRWEPDDLIRQYNLSLAQTALFDATEIRVRSSDPRRLVTAVKRLRLMYEIRKTDRGREIHVTGPDALFRATRRYGTRFARLLRSVAKTTKWRIEATIDDRGTERHLVLTDGDPITVPTTDPVTSVTFDSEVEADFATRFSGLDLDWTLVREPAALETGARVMIPDFAFDYRYADFRVYFEIMGFWTPEYVEKKLDQLAELKDVSMIVAVDSSLGVGEEIEARDHRVVPYSGTVRMRDVLAVLREYEREFEAEHAARLPAELVPDRDVVSIRCLASDFGVSEAAIERKRFPEHDRIGRTLVRPGVLADIADQIEPGMSLAEVDAELDPHGIDESSAVLATLGYRIAWDGLDGGTVCKRDEAPGDSG